MPAAAPLSDFIAALLATGEVAVAREHDFLPDEAAVKQRLAAAMETTLADMPGESALTYQPDIAFAAACYLYRLCLALTDRAMSEEQVHAWTAAMPPIPSTADELLSADLVLRHLPEIHLLASRMSATDPLVAGIETAASRFPLSSVGITLPHLPDLTNLKRHPALWQLYVDRIIERQDASRLADHEVRLAVADALGEHALSLAPKLAVALHHP
jgi:hypothetical protein